MGGKIVGVAGPVVKASGLRKPKINEIVLVGEDRIIGEIIGFVGKTILIQAYEDTVGLRPNEPIVQTGKPLSVELGPGLLGNIYDGIQRPLLDIKKKVGNYVERGIQVNSIDRKKKWRFAPKVKEGDDVREGEVLGVVKETNLVDHFIMIPPGISGKVKSIARRGSYKVEDVIAKIDRKGMSMLQTWPVRMRRPYLEKGDPSEMFVTGQRVFDGLFPLAKGGTGAIPGGFGSGKTVLLHVLTKTCDADVVIYVGCGERGNEMTDILQKLPKMKTEEGKPLMNRTVLIANTSNMPLAAREASVFTGITIAEYYRDMGYNVALFADSTSRWAEALREVAGRLEEIPSEEGYPAYLTSAIGNFYERGGKVVTLGEREGSITVVGAVSPPGGDFYEPVTQSTLRSVKVLWALDTELAYKRHYPAISWFESYSLYNENLKPWTIENLGLEPLKLKERALKILQEEAKLLEIVRLVGRGALSNEQRILLDVAELIRTAFLRQNAFDPVDHYCELKKGFEILRLIFLFQDACLKAIKEGKTIEEISEWKIKDEIVGLKELPYPNFLKERERLIESFGV